MKKRFLFAILSAAVLLTGCGKNADVYVSLNSSAPAQAPLPDALNELLHGEPLCRISGEYTCGDYYGGITHTSGSFDADYCYDTPIVNYPQYTPMSERIMTKLDLRTGEVINTCNVPGCTHDKTDICPYYLPFINNSLRVGNERWSNTGTSVVISSRENLREYRTVFTNPYENKICSPDAGSREKYRIDWMAFADDKLYITVGNFIYSVNCDTMTVASEPIEAGENMFWSFCVFGNKAFLCNEVNELYIVDFEKRTSVKIGDKCAGPLVYDGRLYYVKWDSAAEGLCSSSLDGDDERKIFEDCKGDFYIKDGNVFYSQYIENHNLYMYSLESGEKKLLYEGENHTSMFSAPHIDRVFTLINNLNGDGDRSKAGYYSWKSDGSDPIFISLEDGMRS